MYPAESYLVIGHSGPLPAGVYHYDTAHHSLDRLSIGDQCDAIAAATGVRADLYAVSALRFWKNTFKYHSFGYHVVTQDVGALLASWRLVLAAHRIPAEAVLWFDESAVGAVLEVDECDEAPFIVVPLGPAATGPPAPARRRLRTGSGSPRPRQPPGWGSSSGTCAGRRRATSSPTSRSGARSCSAGPRWCCRCCHRTTAPWCAHWFRGRKWSCTGWSACPPSCAGFC